MTGASRGRSKGPGSARVARAGAAVVVVLAALGLVVWRQARAFEALTELDGTRRDKALLLAERAELERRIQVLESRSRVVPEARRVLGMRTPESAEIVILPGEMP